MTSLSGCALTLEDGMIEVKVTCGRGADGHGGRVVPRIGEW
jgi:hypothetical protein